MRIDWWTLALQTVNVLVLVWLLGRFLFRPVMDIVAKRRGGGKLLADAAAARASRPPMQPLPIPIRTRAEIAAERRTAARRGADAAQTETAESAAQAAQEIASCKRGERGDRARSDSGGDRRSSIVPATLPSTSRSACLRAFRRRSSSHAFVDEICREAARTAGGARSLASATATDQPIEVVAATPLSERAEPACARCAQRGVRARTADRVSDATRR